MQKLVAHIVAPLSDPSGLQPNESLGSIRMLGC